MSSVVKFLFLLVFVPFFNIKPSCGMDLREDPGKELYPSVENVKEYFFQSQLYVPFYKAKISGKNLWLAMEPINGHNRDCWLRYISYQIRNQYSIGKGTSGDGSRFFKKVLDEISLSKNEIWVAYITKSEPSPIEEKDVPGSEDNTFSGSDFTKNIEMFVTVTSSPSALITSHMGIAASAGSGARTKGTSLDLHSFAAKVMLIRNPKRKYMVNAPLFAMEKIIIDALPHSIFIGTREMKEELEKEIQLTFEGFDKENRRKILNEMNEEAKKQLRSLELRLKEDVDDELKKGKTEEEARKIFFDQSWVKNIKENDHSNFKFVYIDDNGTFSISQEKINSQLEDTIRRKFRLHKEFLEAKFKGGVNNFISLLREHPPIISTQYEKISLFDSDKPSEVWLSIAKGNKTYDWMFQSPFLPQGETHYIAVKLKDLADAKQVDPIKKAHEG